MTIEDWCDQLYREAAGWLGWADDQILDCTLERLKLALEGRVSVFKQTWPWGRSKEDQEADSIANLRENPELAVKQLSALFKRKKAHDDRNRKKPKTPPASPDDSEK